MHALKTPRGPINLPAWLLIPEQVSDFVRDRYAGHHEPYQHVITVASQTKGTPAFMVALLHDAVEDGFARWEDVETLLNPHPEADRMLAALRLLTRGPEPYDEYIRAIADSENELAITVKMLDLLDHLSPYRFAGLTTTRRVRYIEALNLLSATGRSLARNNQIEAEKEVHPDTREIKSRRRHHCFGEILGYFSQELARDYADEDVPYAEAIWIAFDAVALARAALPARPDQVLE